MNRARPDQRFSPTVRVIDLCQTVEELAQEEILDDHKHRQISLLKRGSTSLSLFKFEAGALMHEHQVAGTAIIHVIEGSLKVLAEGADHEITTGQLMTLAHGVKHSVVALHATTMLLTVSLDTPTA